MNYELDKICVLVRETLHPIALKRSKFTSAKSEALVLLFQNEKERLYIAFLQASYECKKEKVFKKYISHHQHDLIHFSDIIYDYRSSVKDPIILSLYQQCMRIIEEQLISMRDCFENSFDDRSSVTAYYREISSTEIRKKNDSLRKHLNKFSLPEQLRSLILDSFQAYLTKTNQCSYHLHGYLNALYAALLLTGNEKELLQCLITMNFNCSHFLNWYILHLKTVLYSSDQKERPVYQVAVMIKEQQQQVERCKLAYDPEEMHVTAVICNWLQAEMNCLQMQEDPASYQKPKTGKGKIDLKISVESIGYFLYLFEKFGVVETEVKKDLYELVATHCSSMGQPQIRYRSLLNKSYDASIYTMKKTRELLIKMLNDVNKNLQYIGASVFLMNVFV